MSANRRQYREAQRNYRNNKRVIDWGKIKALLKTMAWAYPLVIICIFIMIFLANYLAVQSRNSKRQAVLASPVITSAAITTIYNSKNNHYATYTFKVSGQNYNGQTFYGYKGKVGDNVCVMFNANLPNKNIYCDNAQVETFKKDVLGYSLYITTIVAGFMVVVIPATFIYLIVRGDKQTLSAYTRKKYP